MKLLHARLEGWTATFRLPLIYSGTSLTAPVPPYSTVLGLLGNMAAREIAPNETRIGYVFRSRGTAYDLETTRRLEMDKSGRLKAQRVPGIAKRQFHVGPVLDLYLDNLAFRKAFELPANAPCFGRSQDIAWISLVEEIDSEPCVDGIIRGTLIPFPQKGASGQILNLPDYFVNDRRGYTRRTGQSAKFLAVRYENPAHISRSDLFTIAGNDRDETVYLRSFSSK
jgi:CRISPR-associated protein Cas5t